MKEKIRDEAIWKYYSQNRFLDIDATKQEMQNMAIRSKAKDDAIEGMQNQIKQLEQLEKQNNQKISTRIQKKINKWIKGVQ